MHSRHILQIIRALTIGAKCQYILCLGRHWGILGQVTTCDNATLFSKVLFKRCLRLCLNFSYLKLKSKPQHRHRS